MVLTYPARSPMHDHLLLLIYQRLGVVTLDDSVTGCHFRRVIVCHVTLHFFPLRAWLWFCFCKETLDPLRPAAQLLHRRAPLRLRLSPLALAILVRLTFALQPV